MCTHYRYFNVVLCNIACLWYNTTILGLFKAHVKYFPYINKITQKKQMTPRAILFHWLISITDTQFSHLGAKLLFDVNRLNFVNSTLSQNWLPVYKTGLKSPHLYKSAALYRKSVLYVNKSLSSSKKHICFDNRQRIIVVSTFNW